MAGRKATSTDAIVEARISQVYVWLLKGLARRDILRCIAEQDPPWGVEARQIDNYIKAANAQFAKQARTHRAREFGKALARMEWLFQSNVKICDYKAALDAQQETNKLLGLYPAIKLSTDEPAVKVYVGIDLEQI